MDEHNDQITSSPSSDRVAIAQCGENQIRMRSQISELKSRTSKDLGFQGFQTVGSMSREWTNEKHSSYLNSMEASFVRRLHNHKYHSMDMLGQQSRLDSLQDTNISLQSNANDLKPSNQFKVLQSGCWKKINFEPGQPKSRTADESRVLLENQWIRHFRYADKQQEFAMPNLPGRGAQSSESIHSGGQKLEHCGAVDWQKAASYGATMYSKKLDADYSHQRDHDYVSGNTEVSDQNFVDEDRAEKYVRAKKMKTTTTDVLITDQVVPLRKFSTTVDLNEIQAYPRKGSLVHNKRQSEVMDNSACPQ